MIYEDFLKMDYPIKVIPCAGEGGFVIYYPDLPGCMTQCDEIHEIPLMAEQIFQLWLETQWDDGFDIPLPGAGPDWFGKGFPV